MCNHHYWRTSDAYIIALIDTHRTSRQLHSQPVVVHTFAAILLRKKLSYRRQTRPTQSKVLLALLHSLGCYTVTLLSLVQYRLAYSAQR